MESISEYIERVFNQFKPCVLNCNNLCDLLEVNFDSDKLPNYSNIHVQELYLLRYAFAYAFEYKMMFKDLFKKIEFNDCIDITSIGCGSMIDYWGLVSAIEDLGLNISIRYRGIDVIDWKYKVEKRKIDEIDFCKTSVDEYFNKVNNSMSKIFVFPKSIGELSYNDIKCISNYLKRNIANIDYIYVLASYSSEGHSNLFNDISNTILSYGFSHNTDIDIIHSYKHIGIRAIDESFNYPNDILEYVFSLYDRCKKINAKKLCDEKCVDFLNKWPMLYADYVNYQIGVFIKNLYDNKC